MELRIQAARERLRRALIAGEPTEKHRAALSALENAEAARLRDVAQAEIERRQAIADRAAVLTSEVHRAIATTIAKHPIPEKTQ